MNKLHISFAALGGAATVVAVYALSGCGNSSESGSTVLAIVNGEAITVDQFHKYLESKDTVRVRTNDNQVAEARVADSLAFQGLQDMIGRQVLMQLAKDEGVYPTDQEISKELEFQQKLSPDFLTNLARQGILLDTVKQNLRLTLTREKLITKGVTVTMAEAEEYIEKNPRQFTDPEKVSMLWVFVKSPDKKEKVDQAIRAGQTFSVVAANYSDFPLARQQGGRFVGPDGRPERIIDQLDPALRDLVRKTSENQVTDWLTLSDGSARFFVEKKIKAAKIDMNNYRKEAVRRELAMRRGAQAIDLNKRLLEKLLESKVDVKERSLVEPWNAAFERYKQEQKVDVPGGSDDEKVPDGS